MNNWKFWMRGYGRPDDAVGFVDIKYLDGKEFYRKPIENVYWGADSLVEYWRPA